MDKAELPAQIEAMTEEEAAEVKLIDAPDWPGRVTPIEEVHKRRGARPEALRRFDDGTPQPDWVALLHADEDEVPVTQSCDRPATTCWRRVSTRTGHARWRL